MITLKLWNSLSNDSRNEICSTLGVYGAVTQPYHHNFDFDNLGHRVKWVLEQCNLQKDGTINIVVNFRPSFAPEKPIQKKEPAKKVKAKKEVAEKKHELKRWKFRRYTYDDPDDGEWVWCEAETLEEARDYLEREYWNTKELVFWGNF